MKLLGDASKKDRDLAEELEAFELSIEGKTKYPKEKRAQMLVCLAYDWFELDCEEEGNRLLLKASEVCPGYFQTFMLQHQREDRDFNLVVKGIGLKLINNLLENICVGSVKPGEKDN